MVSVGPGLPLDADTGLSGKDFFIFGGARGFVTDEDRPVFAGGLMGREVGVEDLDVGLETEIIEGRGVGVEDLDADLEAGSMEGRAVGVEKRADDIGVVDRFVGGTGFVVAIVGRDVGVEDLDGFVVEGIVGRVVGVDDLETVAGAFLDGDGRLIDDFMEVDGSLGATFVVEIFSVRGFSSLDLGEVD